jgi:hypothetical protein
MRRKTRSPHADNPRIPDTPEGFFPCAGKGIQRRHEQIFLGLNRWVCLNYYAKPLRIGGLRPGLNLFYHPAY